MNDLTITVSGWVATEPRHVVGPTGTSLTSFRVATTSRYFDRTRNAWQDAPTEWFTVRTFRNAAITVQNSIAKGQPVVVTGRLRTNTWESDSGPRTDLVIDATAVGHDLTRGVAKFRRAVGDASLGVEGALAVPAAGADGAERGADVPQEGADRSGRGVGVPDEGAEVSEGADASEGAEVSEGAEAEEPVSVAS